MNDVSNSIEAAVNLTVRFHQGQRDKAGHPYILHPLRLMLQSNDPLVQQAAVLHDILEDTTATVEDLRNAGVHPAAIAAVELLTHSPADSYAEYVVRLKRNAIAREAKLLDLNDNYRLDRVAYREGHFGEDSIRLQKYILTRQFLTDSIDEDAYRLWMYDLENGQRS